MREVHYSERYDTQESLITPWKLPGGRNFLIRILLWGTALMLLSYFFLGRGSISAYMEFIRDVAVLEGAETDSEAAESLQVFSSIGKFYGALFFVSIFTWCINVSMETAIHKNIFLVKIKAYFHCALAEMKAALC